ncbi:caspase family protein [Bradyrhizobium daqingense]|uniref:Tetratricopeptide repeat protein n=1 Tax=Bradyrhizobium daqingense TaxID=993502 RepID=A0A562KY24_9BRAD|nr:tetratricopeptide repeat protein [Bradyrhizobium daqingense]TWI00084.1 tetratricopeptide repeat protein [Bradyrhizobium daqingense]UFS90445.1 caspase family protein [Bradyrhizobium daqingense]
MRDIVQAALVSQAIKSMRRAAAFTLLVTVVSFLLAQSCWAASQSRENCKNRGFDADGTIQACTDLLQKRSWDSFVHLHVRSVAWLAKQNCEQALSDENESIRLFLTDPLVARKKMSEEDRNFFRRGGFLGRIEIYLFCFLNYDKALSVVEEALAIYPDDTDLYNRRGLIYIQTKNFDQAFRDLQRAIDLADKKDVALNNRASVFNGLGDFDNAIRDANGAIAFNPRSEGAHVNRAVALSGKGEHGRAIEEINVALRLDPKNQAGPLAQRSKYHLKGGDLDSALKDISRSIALFEQSKVEPIIALCVRGDLFRFQGQLSRSLEDFDRAIRSRADFAAAYTGRGLTYERMGNLKNARTDFEKALGFPAQQYDNNLEAQTTARARLAALDSGEAQPVIPATTGKPVAPFSVTTPPLVAPVLAHPRLLPGSERQGRRVAPVIGNAAYQRAGILKNPLNDSEAVAAALRNIGFDEVMVATDTTKERLTAALQGFARASDNADWAVVYYSGHGIEMAGRNYLLPIDVTLRTDRDVQFEAVPVDQVMASIDGARKLKLIVLDACRNNPFADTIKRTGPREAVTLDASNVGEIGTRAVGRGLGEIKVKGASLVVFAAKHGQTALDGEGRNSPFAIALVQRIATPGVEMNKVFRLVRDDVLEATAGRQEPYTYGSLPGREDFFFVSK